MHCSTPHKFPDKDCRIHFLVKYIFLKQHIESRMSSKLTVVLGMRVPNNKTLF